MSKKADSLTKPIFQGPSVSKNGDLLTGPVFHGSAVSKNGDLLTGPVFQGSAVSKNGDSLTKPIFQMPSVSKNGDSLTEIVPPPEKAVPQPEYTTSGCYDPQLHELAETARSALAVAEMTYQKKIDYICVSKGETLPISIRLNVS